MKKILKRLKLSEWLVISQVIISLLTLVFAFIFGNEIIDLLGLAANVLNGALLIVVCFYENSKSIKSHELMGQFIFNRVGDNFSEFMDFLMSDRYEKTSFDERNLLHGKLVEMAKTGDYDTKRKLSRAIPYIFDIDKRMAADIIEVLRKDLFKNRTDIRRRTLEGALSIIQRQPTLKKQRRCAREFFELFAYRQFDDSYTIVASIECYFFIHEFVFDKADKAKCITAMEKLKEDVKKSFDLGIGVIEECLVGDTDNIWKVLSSLSCIQNIRNTGYSEARKFIDGMLVGGAKFSKLTIVKNLYYTCEGFPECLSGARCEATSSVYMMEKILGFLTKALDGNIFLSMPTVRYFDCVCNNVCRGEAGCIAREIIKKYFSSSELLISQTAFDKFSKLLKEDPKFAKEVLANLLSEENKHSAAASENIIAKIKELPEEERALFTVESSRVKLKNTVEHTALPAELSDGAKEVHTMIEEYNDRIKYIGKIKRFKEENKL